MMRGNRIKEKGERSIKIFSYVVTLLFVISALVPLLWLIVSSLKDNNSIEAYPPKWIPSIPQAVQVTLDYTGTEGQDERFYEVDAMQAIWYPWMTSLRENIGEVEVQGVKDGRLLYRARTVSASFFAGQPFVVPSTLFNENMMNVKLDTIHKQKLSSFEWYGDAGVSFDPPTGRSEETISGKFGEFYDSTDLVDGEVVSIEQSGKWIRMLDSYLALNKISQATAGALGFFKYFLNSAIVTLSSVAIQLLLGGLAGYALSQLIPNPKIKFPLLMFFLATIMIPDISLILPLYFTMQQLDLVDTLWAIILPHSAWGIVIYLFKGFFDQLPGELMQAARVDGASEFRTFLQIAVPLSIPVFTTIAVMTFIPVWNEFMWPLIVTKTPENWTFTVALNDLQHQTSIRQNTLMASSFVSMIPLLIVFLTCQKYIEKGVSFSGVKG